MDYDVSFLTKSSINVLMMYMSGAIKERMTLTVTVMSKHYKNR